ncbi:MAG: hypothetical protein V2I36_10300 [Desulfopila sp.]|nr:hypothetical protein [Desulfopila sp.]
MLTGVIILFFYFRSDIFRQNEIQLAPHLKETQKYSSTPQYNSSVPKPQYSKPAEKRLNENRTSTKYESPPIKTNSNRVQNNQRVSSTEKPPYQFEIELHSGGKIYTDNADIEDDVVTFTNHKGLVVSINRGEIKDMKWVNAY